MNFDIVIVGGGLVGASLACALKDQPFKIALIDVADQPAPSEKVLPEDQSALGSEALINSRALALSHTSLQCLKTIGVWDLLSKQASPIRSVHASKKGCFGQTRILACEHELSELGMVVGAEALTQALYQYLTQKPTEVSLQIKSQLQIFKPDKILKLEKKLENEPPQNQWVIDLESGKRLTAKLLVGADGTNSLIRKHHGIDSISHDYQQIAIVSNIKLSRSHQGVAYERFLENGSIAMLPFGENLVKCVWILPTVIAQNILELPNKEFLEKLKDQFGFRLGHFVELGERIQYPLRLNYAESIYGQQFVLIGNAANTLNPIAAQGFNLGLRDVATLAEVLVQAEVQGLAINATEVLASYATQRQSDHQAIRALTDQLAHSSVLQSLGVLASEWVSPFKNRLVEQGLGRQQLLPKLCRGVRIG